MKILKTTVGALLLSYGLHAQVPASEVVIDDPISMNEHGFDVSVHQNFIITSSPFENDYSTGDQDSTYYGNIRFFKNNMFVRNYRYQSSLPVNTFLGIGQKNSISIGNQALVFGARQYDTLGLNDVGQVLVANKSGDDYETNLHILTPPTFEENAAFGTAVDTDQDWIAVGSPTYHLHGEVTIFQKVSNQWTSQGNIPLPTGLSSNAKFGFAVAMKGNNLIVGAPGDNTFYVYKRNGTQYELKGEYLGKAFGMGRNVDISYNYLVASNNSSSVSIYHLHWDGTWIPFQTLEGIGNFGVDVAIDNSKLIVGNSAFNEVSYYQLQGKFTRIGEMYVDVANSPNGLNTLRLLGHSVALDGENVVAGDPNAMYSVDQGEGTVVHAKFYDVWQNQGVNNEESNAVSLKVTPNPANQYIQVDVDNILSINAIDPFGLRYIVRPPASNGGQSSISHLPEGIYCIIVTTEDGIRRGEFIVRR